MLLLLTTYIKWTIMFNIRTKLCKRYTYVSHRRLNVCDVGVCARVSEWASEQNDRTFCIVQPRHVLTSSLTVEVNAGAASFLRFSQTLKSTFVWIYSTRGPHLYQSKSAASRQDIDTDYRSVGWVYSKSHPHFKQSSIGVGGRLGQTT